MTSRGLKRSLAGLFLLTACWGQAVSQTHAIKTVEGDWLGTLKVQGAELRLALHISKSADGSLKATVDSLDQGANGIAVTSISVKDSKLVFTVESIHGSYEGTVSADGISGTWTQGQALPLDFQRGTAPAQAEFKPAKPTDMDGAWSGAIDAGMMKLRIVIHITNTDHGLMATMDSPDQGAMGIPVTAVTRSGSSLKLEMKQLGGVFEGKIATDLSAIQGTWTQGGNSMPLELTHAKGAAIPRGRGPFPAVVLITGSGPQDRDESLLGHKPFLVLSDYLTRKGIVVLRADDRGFAKSGGNFATATTADFACLPNHILALHQPAGISPSRYVFEADVVR